MSLARLPVTVTNPSAAIAPAAPAVLLNSVGTSTAVVGCGGGGGGGGGGGNSLAAGVAASFAPACVPTNSVLSSGENVTHHTLDFSAGRPSCSPFAFTSQSFTAPSRLALASRLPSDENATDVTQSLCPLSVAYSFASLVVQSLIVRSAPAVASREPSGE